VTDLAAQAAGTGASLVSRAAAGDETAFVRLIAQHNASMTRVAYVIAGDRDAAIDAVQSAWVVAWRRIGSVRDPDRVGQWLIAVAANEARQHHRRERRVQVIDISHAMSRAVSEEPRQTAAVMDLEKALRGLDRDDRRLLALRFVAGFDSVEIATAMGLSASGVRSRLARLLERLRNELEPAQVTTG